MPLYEYVCPHCNEKRELLARRAETAAPSCPACGRAMDKQWATVAVGKSTAGGGCSPRGGFS